MSLTRTTIQYQLIYKQVLAMDDHPTANDIYQALREEHPHISKGTVYRNLNRLVKMGKVKRVEIPNEADRFDSNTHEHFHLICTNCAYIHDVEIDNIDNVINKISNTNNFRIDSFKIIFWGRCNNCIKKEKEN